MVHSHDFYRLYQETYTKYTELYGQVCVFLQKGSFYELYGQQNPATKEVLNTGRQILEHLGLQMHIYPDDGPGGTTGFYGGVPIYTLDKWAGKLTSQGWSVVVIDEVKNGAGKVSGRQVSRVLSPGTHLDSAESNKTFILASLWLEFSQTEAPQFGVAVSDLTTGQVFLYEGSATGKADVWHTDDLRHFFQVYPPKELLLFTRGNSLYTLEEETLRRTFYIPKAPIHMKKANPEQQGALEKTLSREDYLRQMFQPKSSLPLRTWLRCSNDGESLQERALVGLLRFAEDHAPKLAECLQAPQLWHPTQSLQIINNALTQLNLIGNQEQQCVEDLFSTPITAMGKRNLTARLCSPVADTDEILKRQQKVEWFTEKDTKNVELGLGGMFDLSRLHRSIIRGTIRASDVLQLFQSYKSIELLCEEMKNSPFQESSQLKSSAQSCISGMLNLFDLEKAGKSQESPEDTGCLLKTAGPKSFEAENRIADIYRKANTWLETLLGRCKISSDSAYFKPSEKNMFLVHSSKSAIKTLETSLKTLDEPQKDEYKKLQCKTLTSAGRIEHPALEKFQEELDSARAMLARCLALEIPAACIRFSSETRGVWQQLENWVIDLDLSLTMAKTAKQQGWVKPTIETEMGESRVWIMNLRHPLIEVQKRQSKYVTHDVSLGFAGGGHSWLLYGMNASGKSSLMKAIGLAVLLAQVGSYVPATEMVLRPFRRIATRILNQDNLWAGLSSFAVEMSELREILSVADEHTLVLGDELCAGTESISGTAIVAAGIQHLYKTRSRFVLATHLHDLMKLPQVTSLRSLDIWHLHVEYDPIKDLLVYHRKLRPGPGSTMYGLEVAKALHLPRDMIEQAFEMRRALLGTITEEDAKVSSWNSELTRKACSACGTMTEGKLEVHHLQERADANHGRNRDGTALHHVRNLAVLCDTCHDKHHSGLLVVGDVEDTSEGPKRKILDFTKYNHTSTEEKPATRKKSNFSEQQNSEIQALVRANPGLSVKLLCFQIRQTLQLEITEAQFRTLQKHF
jgi:DNA mismatch repair protein MutS